ncbi:MAG: hypothetical protein DCC67_03630 [Planctomycetota bacterium]|nr:MAG: hypothetical protein DCC67_03630 [Planctomycetota bacterium]
MADEQNRSNSDDHDFLRDTYRDKKRRENKLPEDPWLMNAKDVAQALAISMRTLWRLVSARRFPEPIRLGGSTRWLREDVLKWLREGGTNPGNDQQ